MVNTWDGTLEELHDLEGKIFTHEDLETAIKQYVFNSYCGLGNLEGAGELAEYFDDIDEQLITRGRIALVEYNDKKFLANIKEEQNNLLNKYDEVTLTLLDNPKIQIKSNKKDYPYRYVVFENNKQNDAYMKQIDYFIQQMIGEVKKMARDAFLCERKLIFIVPEQPDEADAQYLVKMWKKGIFFFIAFEKSRRPGIKGGSDGKQGIHPSQVNFQTYEPKLDMVQWYIRNYEFWHAKMEKYLGIRHDPLVQKQERASVAEVNASTSPFDAFERRGFKSRVRGIKEYIKVFEGGKGSCNFTYGKYKFSLS
ncbi:hypothetical protein [endosymbiont GvMRE of Glomus versiforme]|uniref:hypothetical protein n=1 Tax=endosymbiont GvMRE of Glomus versiforme TaxID=2039283 RepID=UPI0011C42DD0|nr:hypothetical protein [endosymbiont GvMRE of Glomus versiforme]